MTRPSRRDFLKGSAMVAGAALAASWNPARMVHAAGGETIRVALIGSGNRGSGAGNDLLTAAEQLQMKGRVKIVAVADAFQDRVTGAVERLKKIHGDSVDVPPDRQFVGLDAYQKAIGAGVDMVILATPPGFRPTHYKAAVEAGKNVFMEKPCCIDAPGFRSLLESNKLADQRGLKVGVGLQRHHQPDYQETVKRIHDGALGKILLLRAYWNGSGIWNRERQPDMTEMQYQIHNWYHFIWLSGDNICEQHVHNIDVCNWVMNDHPVEANGMGGCTTRYVGKTKGTGQIFDHHFVEFTYKDGTKLYSQCRHMAQCWNSVSEAAHGTLGESNCTNKITGQNAWTRAGGESDDTAGKPKGKGKKKSGGQSPYVQEHVELLQAIVKNEKHNEGHYGATSSFTAVMGRMANYSGQAVKWDDAAAKGPSEMPERLAWDAMPKAVKNEQGDYPIAIPGVYKAY